MSVATCTGELSACAPEQGLSSLGIAMLTSHCCFRHLPVSGDAGPVGMPDITDVRRALIDPDLSQRPTPGPARLR